MKAFLLALALTAPADTLQADLSHPWSFRECVEWALENNLTVASQAVTLEEREVERQSAGWAFAPVVSAYASENVNFGRGIGGDNTYQSGNSASTSFSLSGSMTLFDGLATPRRLELAKLNLEAATADLARAREDVRVAVASAYLQVLFDYEIEGVARHQLGIDSLQVARLEGLFEAGKASAAQVSEQKASYAQSYLSLVQAENNVTATLLDLAQLLELSDWDDFSILRPKLSFHAEDLPDPDDVYADALLSRPSVQAEQLRLKGTEKSLQIAKAGYYPTLTLTGGLGTNYYTTFGTVPFWQQLGNNFSQYIGLSLNIPIFDRFYTRGQVRMARLNRTQQEIQLLRTERTLYKEIQQACIGAAGARAKWNAAQTASKAADDALVLATAKYENGKSTLTEFNEARARQVKAESEALQATYEYLFQTDLIQYYRTGVWPDINWQ